MSRGFRGLTVAGLAVGALLATASQAAADTTIGQLDPSPTTKFCTFSADYLNPIVTSGNSYVVPAGGATITSWSTNAIAGTNQMMTMKVYRYISGSGPNQTWMLVGHDGPRALGTAGGLNAFPGINIPVQPGDVLGVGSANAATVNNDCLFSSPDTSLEHSPELSPDGASGMFGITTGRANITAVVAPTPMAGQTGLRAAALKKCKHKHGHKRNKCKKRANKLPV